MKEKKPTVAKLSATVVILKEDQNVLKILLVRRRPGDAFGDSYAFPGGVLDKDEINNCIPSWKLSNKTASKNLKTQKGLSYYSAAIRELFEETGILLAKNRLGQWVAINEKIIQERNLLNEKKLNWIDFLNQHNLSIAAESLNYFAFWETPYTESKRWETRFFLSKLPPQQLAVQDGNEVTDCLWIEPKRALALNNQGKLNMPMPTISCILDISSFITINEINQWAERKANSGIKKIIPT